MGGEKRTFRHSIGGVQKSMSHRPRQTGESPLGKKEKGGEKVGLIGRNKRITNGRRLVVM